MVRVQKPRRPEVAEALARCTHARVESVAYIYFVDPVDANGTGAEWQFSENVILESLDRGQLVLDVLTDGRIGGVEFLARVHEVD